MSQEVFVIVPFSRPNYLQNIIDNFNRQSYPYKKLIIVENGNALGTCSKVDYHPYKLFTSNAFPGDARNAALLFLKKKYDDVLWVNFDDDDYYGPEYISEIVSLKDKATGFVKVNILMKTVEDRLWFIDRGHENKYIYSSDLIFGFSMAGWSKDSPMFVTGIKTGEDNHWAHDLLYSYKKLYAPSRYNAIFRRYNTEFHGDHTWKCEDDLIAKHAKYAEDLGKYNVNIIDRDYGNGIPLFQHKKG